jgi:chemotaxis family two-component system sensor kinase Cph1
MSNQNQVNETNCEKEPIAYINEIQPFGAMLVLDSALNVVQISANIGDWLGGPAKEIIGKHVSEFLSQRHIDSLIAFAKSRDRALVPVGLLDRKMKANAIAHMSDGYMIIELEPRDETTEPESADDAANGLQESVSILAATKSVDEFARCLAHCVRTVTQFDRVMIYRFHEDWHGEVIAEELRDGVDSYMGNHFPASDIPEPARRMFSSIWTRIIADVSQTPLPMVPDYPAGRSRPINLTLSSLRQPSGIHIEYLKNMNVGASLTISLMLNGKLWGLVACHHNQAKYVSYWVRSVCEFIGKFASQQLSSVIDVEAKNLVAQFSKLGQRIIESKNRLDVFEAISKQALELFDATSVLYVSDEGEIESSAGDTKSIPKEVILKLLDNLKNEKRSSIFFSNRLPTSMEFFAPYKALASGLIAVRMLKGYLLILRPEYVQVLTWGGNPDKAVSKSTSDKLHPRKSFEAWKEQVEGHSRRWSDAEVVAAESLAALIDASVPLYHQQENKSSEIKDELRSSLTSSIKLLEELRQDELVSPVFSFNLKTLQARFDDLSNLVSEA